MEIEIPCYDVDNFLYLPLASEQNFTTLLTSRHPYMPPLMGNDQYDCTDIEVCQLQKHGKLRLYFVYITTYYKLSLFHPPILTCIL